LITEADGQHAFPPVIAQKTASFSFGFRSQAHVCNDWFVALDDIGAERASDFSVSKLDQVVDARLGKWTVITCNFSREEIAEHMDVRIASRLGRGKNVIVDGIFVRDYSTRSQKEVA
jgi:DNA replication protein DnaC